MSSACVALQANEGQQWLLFRDPVAVIEARTPAEVRARLDQVCALVEERGLYAAGFITYEAAPAFDSALRVRPATWLPLLWFGLYPPPEVSARPPDDGCSPAADAHFPPPGDLGWSPAIDRGQYDRAIARIKSAIAAGDTYQVNYTFPLRTPFAGDPWPLFLQMTQGQRGRYAAYVDTGRYAICSASPELFFTLEGDQLLSRPMKGTTGRGRTLAEDEARQRWLQQSEKNRAENVMIVDMIRNDMGRIARFASVQTPSLFDVTRYPTLWQMTSTVTARSDAPLGEIMAALFPCASITGAPKVRTMQIIAELEPHPRGVYTGCIGYVAPGRRAQFNVAIRTVVVDRAAGQATYGVGGGIVWDSNAEDEHRECLLKAQVLTQPRPDFELLETMLWTPRGGYFLLDRHLLRLADSAVYFGAPVDLAQVRRQLARLAAALSGQPHKVRLLVAQDGTSRVQAAPLPAAAPRPLRVGLAAQPVQSGDPFLFHKTTQRRVYEAARASRPDCDDALLWNERGELTEASTANVVLQLAGQLVTPPVECGLLAGVFRGWLLDRKIVRERVITIGQLADCQRLFLVNSVRRWLIGELTIGEWLEGKGGNP